MAQAFALSPYGAQAEVVRLSDGRLAERSFNRAGRQGWLVYSAPGAREAFYTDKQWARKEVA